MDREPQEPLGRGLLSAAARGARNLLLLTLPSLLVLLLALEVFFRVVIPGAEIPTRYYDPDLQMMRFDTDGPREGLFTRGRFAEVRGRWRINDHGWNSSKDYQVAAERDSSRTLVAVIGDSFVNGFQVDPEENFAELLEGRLGPGVDVYRFGMPGAPLSQYLHVSRYVARLFDPEVMVFLAVHNDFFESVRDLHPAPHFLQLAQAEDGLVEVTPQEPPENERPLWLRSALIRYLRITLQSYLLAGGTPEGAQQRFVANVPVDELASEREILREATDYVVERIRRENPDRTVVFAMDPPRQELYEGRLEESRVSWLNDMLAAACRRHGVVYADLRPEFVRLYAGRHERFESDVDSHWNELGHRAAADVLARELQRLGVGAEARAGASQDRSDTDSRRARTSASASTIRATVSASSRS